jgi:hypothetical protein
MSACGDRLLASPGVPSIVWKIERVTMGAVFGDGDHGYKVLLSMTYLL